MGPGQGVGVHEVLEAVDAAGALETTHGVVDLRVDEPEQRRHRRAVAQVWFVLDDDRPAVESPHDDGASSREWPSEIGLNDGEVVGNRVAKAQRQNSRVRTRRETNAFADEWCARVADVLAAANDETDAGETNGWRPGSPTL